MPSKSDGVFLSIDVLRRAEAEGKGSVPKRHAETMQDWAVAAGAQGRYDVFLSYRHNEPDAVLVEGLYEAVCSWVAVPDASGLHQRPVVFHDRRRLSLGRSIFTMLADALLSTTVLVAIMSTRAMERLTQENTAGTVDALLFEWWFAIELLGEPAAQAAQAAPQSSMRRVVPLFADPAAAQQNWSTLVRSTVCSATHSAVVHEWARCGLPL